MSLTARLDNFQRRHPAASFPIAVLYKFIDDGGGYLAALITYYGFLALFPLLLLASTILGIVLSGDPAAQQTVLHSALGQFPVIGRQLQQPGRIGGGLVGLLVGGLGALYGGLGFAMALQNAMNTAWAIPKNSRPNPFKARARAVLLLTTVGLGAVGVAVLSAIGGGVGPLGIGLRILALALSVVLNTTVLVMGFRIATARRLTTREVAPGAVIAALIWQLLQSFGATYVGHVVKSASDTGSVFAVVLGLIAFIHLASLTLVLCVEVDVVHVERLYPRALLTPVTDNVDLTEGDERVYANQAKAQRSKGFEEIDVKFTK